jgi:hypothetical protein
MSNPEQQTEGPVALFQAALDQRIAESPLGRFITDCCVEGGRCHVKARTIYRHYEKWCEKNSKPAESQTKFGTWLSDLGFIRVKLHGGIIWWLGLALAKADGDAVGGEKSECGNELQQRQVSPIRAMFGEMLAPKVKQRTRRPRIDWASVPITFIPPAPAPACPACGQLGHRIIRSQGRETDGSISRRCVCRHCSAPFLVVVEPELASDWQVDGADVVDCRP